jgi:hypothetical protein
MYMKHSLRRLLLVGSSLVAVGLVLPLSAVAGASSRYDDRETTTKYSSYEDNNRKHESEDTKRRHSDKHRDSKKDESRQQDDKQDHKKDHARRDDHKQHGQHDSRLQDKHKKDHSKQQDRKHSDSDKKHSDSKRELHRKLDALLRQHAAVGVAALKAELHGTPDADALAAAVEANNMAIARTVNKLYPGTKSEFLQLWRSHIGDYQQYMHAAWNGDREGKQEAKRDLAAVVQELTELLNNANHRLDQHQLKQQLAKHGKQTTLIIEKLVEGDYHTAQNLADKALHHMSAIAKTLSLSHSHGRH